MTYKGNKSKTFISKAFYDKDGHLILFQVPNVPLILCLISAILGMVLTGIPQTVAILIFNASFLSWAILELTTGVNYFRRSLGLIAIIYMLMQWYR
jgi:hypothetical protein